MATMITFQKVRHVRVALLLHRAHALTSTLVLTSAPALLMVPLSMRNLPELSFQKFYIPTCLAALHNTHYFNFRAKGK